MTRRRARGMPSGTEECWYVVDAEPGAVVGVGTKHSLTSEELYAASLSSDIEALMDWKPAKAGDYFYIPAGTVHAIGAGISLVEVQQYADITYRLYDYGRDRELHLDDGVAISSAIPYTDARPGQAGLGTQLVDSPHFQLWYVSDINEVQALPPSGNIWITPLSGQVQTDGGGATKGDCIVISGQAKITFHTTQRRLLPSRECRRFQPVCLPAYGAIPCRHTNRMLTMGRALLPLKQPEAVPSAHVC